MKPLISLLCCLVLVQTTLAQKETVQTLKRTTRNQKDILQVLESSEPESPVFRDREVLARLLQDGSMSMSM
jgi:hypothetical protein